MKNLFIIGNGFDIHYGINSRYSDYREWLKGYDFDLYNKLCLLYVIVSANRYHCSA